MSDTTGLETQTSELTFANVSLFETLNRKYFVIKFFIN